MHACVPSGVLTDLTGRPMVRLDRINHQSQAVGGRRQMAMKASGAGHEGSSGSWRRAVEDGVLLAKRAGGKVALGALALVH